MYSCVLDYGYFGANMSSFLNKPHERQLEYATDDATFKSGEANNDPLQLCHVKQHLKYNYRHFAETRILQKNPHCMNFVLNIGQKIRK